MQEIEESNPATGTGTERHYIGVKSLWRIVTHKKYLTESLNDETAEMCIFCCISLTNKI